MSNSLQILAEQEALTLLEKAKRKDQSLRRPRVHEKIQNFFPLKSMYNLIKQPVQRIVMSKFPEIWDLPPEIAPLVTPGAE